MDADSNAVLTYRRAQFATPLPLAFRYTASHVWLAQQPDERWRVGLTKFGTRMLGEIVDHGFQIEPGAASSVGQIIGFIEGFKAISDLVFAGEGRFLGGNPALREKSDLVNDDPLGAGWLYEFAGTPDPRAMDAPAYAAWLDATIDRLRESADDAS